MQSYKTFLYYKELVGHGEKVPFHQDVLNQYRINLMSLGYHHNCYQ